MSAVLVVEDEAALLRALSVADSSICRSLDLR
jgi:hypothetical protein